MAVLFSIASPAGGSPLGDPAGGLSQGVHGSSGPPDIPPVESVTDLGTLQQNEDIKGRDGGWSAKSGARSIWTFGDTALHVGGQDDDHWANKTRSWTGDLAASDGIVLESDLVDRTGALTEAIPLTGREARYNEHRIGHRGLEAGRGDRQAHPPPGEPRSHASRPVP